MQHSQYSYTDEELFKQNKNNNCTEEKDVFLIYLQVRT